MAQTKTISANTIATPLTPVITEKSAHLAQTGAYVFVVPKHATKVSVAQAFKNIYGLTPKRVNMLITHGKEHRFGRAISRRPDLKRAIVYLNAGERVDLFEKTTK
ncbi:MAG: 50S ribosomal protein L23 [Patescibacteria group bacterium]